jgi:hypothetical protein
VPTPNEEISFQVDDASAEMVSIQVLADPRPVAGTMGSTSSSACIVPER